MLIRYKRDIYNADSEGTNDRNSLTVSLCKSPNFLSHPFLCVTLCLSISPPIVLLCMSHSIRPLQSVSYICVLCAWMDCITDQLSYLNCMKEWCYLKAACPYLCACVCVCVCARILLERQAFFSHSIHMEPSLAGTTGSKGLDWFDIILSAMLLKAQWKLILSYFHMKITEKKTGPGCVCVCACVSCKQICIYQNGSETKHLIHENL